MAKLSVTVALCLVADDGEFLPFLESLVYCLHLGTLDIRHANRCILAVINKKHFIKFYRIALLMLAKKLNIDYIPDRNHILLAAGLNNSKFLRHWRFSRL